MTTALPWQLQVEPLQATQFAALQAAYATPPRVYHDFGHVDAVLGWFNQVAAGPGWTQPVEVHLAVLYHDVIDAVGRGDNEARSASMALRHIDRWLPDADIDACRVARLITLTARHGRVAPDDLDNDPCPDDARHFLDCDMAILGAPARDFDACDRAICDEYLGHVPGWLFRRKRRAFMQSLLASDRIFLSDFFDARLDAQARINLRRILLVAG